MRDGKCPRCNSASVYSKLNGMNLGEGGVHVYISSEVISRPVRGSRHYICTTCGYYEAYIEDKPKLEAVTKDWKKVS